jgi:ubiquitin-protein ligase
MTSTTILTCSGCGITSSQTTTTTTTSSPPPPTPEIEPLQQDNNLFLLSCSHAIHIGLRPIRVVPNKTATKTMFIHGVRFACAAVRNGPLLKNALECCTCSRLLSWNECASVCNDRDSYLALGLDMLKSPDISPDIVALADRLTSILKGDLTAGNANSTIATASTTTNNNSQAHPLPPPPPPPQPTTTAPPPTNKTLSGYDQIRSLFEFYESNSDIEQYGDVLTMAIADAEGSGKIKEKQAQEFWDRLEKLSEKRSKNVSPSTTTSTTPTKLPTGTGYGGDQNDASQLKKTLEASETKRKRERKERDTLLVNTLQDLIHALGKLDKSSSTFVAIESLFRRDGGVIHHLRVELQNDMEDILNRDSTFMVLLELCHLFASTASLVPLLLSSKHIKTSPPKCSQNFLLEWAKNPREKIPDSMMTLQFAEEGSTILDTLKTLQSSLAKLKGNSMEERLYNLVSSCIKDANTTQKLHPHFINMDEKGVLRQKMVEIFSHSRMVEATTVTTTTTSINNSSNISTTTTTNNKLTIELQKQTLRTIYCELLEQYKFVSCNILQHIKDETIDYAYATSVIGPNVSSRPPPKERMRRIAVELSGLQNSLAVHWGSTVFFATDEERPDIISFLVVGPEGTPYQNGLFLFDLFLPLDFPQSPPQCVIKTTGGGKVRFNPNLYANGKVCLSLLGTWSGPPWDPKTSTLLQLIISIQSLILVPYPYTNEPGFETTSLNDNRVVDYNTNVRLNNLRLAMLDTLRHPPKLFVEVVKLHFALKRDEIMETLEQWQTALVRPTEIEEGRSVGVSHAVNTFNTYKKELLSEMNKVREELINNGGKVVVMVDNSSNLKKSGAGGDGGGGGAAGGNKGS